MILEVAHLHVRSGQTSDFEVAFAEAQGILARMRGYVGHEVQKCLEEGHQYLLLVWWETLEDHTVGFRQSAEYQEWRRLLHHFYDPFPVVQHFVKVPELSVWTAVKPGVG